MNLSVEAVRAAEEAEERRLWAARDSFPDWQIIETRSGAWMAVPAAVEIVDANTLDEIVMKLRMERGK